MPKEHLNSVFLNIFYFPLPMACCCNIVMVVELFTPVPCVGCDSFSCVFLCVNGCGSFACGACI